MKNLAFFIATLSFFAVHTSTAYDYFAWIQGFHSADCTHDLNHVWSDLLVECDLNYPGQCLPFNTGYLNPVNGNYSDTVWTICNLFYDPDAEAEVLNVTFWSDPSCTNLYHELLIQGQSDNSYKYYVYESQSGCQVIPEPGDYIASTNVTIYFFNGAPTTFHPPAVLLCALSIATLVIVFIFGT